MSKYSELQDVLTQKIVDLGLTRDLTHTLLEAAGDAASEHDREVKSLEESLRTTRESCAKLSDQRDTLASQLAAAKENQAAGMGTIGRLWRHVDGERLIELAFKQDPHRARICLNSLGGSLIAGELRDRALVAEQGSLFPERHPSVG
jgi:hypothetical protein